MIKKYLFSLVLLFCISKAWSYDSKFTISKVKVFLDDVEIIEDSDGAIYGLFGRASLGGNRKN